MARAASTTTPPVTHRLMSHCRTTHFRRPAVPRWIAALSAVILAAVNAPLLAQAPAVSRSFQAHDTIDPAVADAEQSDDARQMLADLLWEPSAFDVTCFAADPRTTPGFSASVAFASPQPQGDAVNDRVVLEWYAARDAGGDVIDAPAVLILHILDHRLVVDRAIARGLNRKGLHAFLMHMPGYGQRIGAVPWATAQGNFVTRVRQAIVDARRARDAIAVLPHIQTDRIALEGTSLGGFIASVAGAIDGAFDPIFIVLAGGDLYDIVMNGRYEAVAVRAWLESGGFVGPALQQLLWQVEPTRLAHRLNPNRTWLVSATDDEVVPLANARMLAQAADLTQSHHRQLSGGHITAAIHLPRLIDWFATTIQAPTPAVAAQPPTASIKPSPPDR
jgi:pimeloyl-ACP methyl ester carboxylesterase